MLLEDTREKHLPAQLYRFIAFPVGILLVMLWVVVPLQKRALMPRLSFLHVFTPCVVR